VLPLNVFRFGGDGAYVAQVAFRDLSRSGVSTIALRQWDFGDGMTSSDENPSVTLIGGPRRTVTLRCMDALGYSGEWTQRLRFDGPNVRRVDVDMELSVSRSLLLKGEAAAVKVACRKGGREELKMTLTASIATSDGTVLAKWRKPLELTGEKWRAVEFQIGRINDVPVETGSVDFRLEYMNQPVMRRGLVIRKAAEDGAELELSAGKLVDSNGDQVILRLSDKPVAPPAAPLAAKLARGEKVRIVFVDDALGGSGKTSYIDRFLAQLRAAFPRAGVTAERIGNREARSYTAFQRLVTVSKAVRKGKPDLVVVAGSLRDIMRFDSIPRFERQLMALVERIQASCKNEVVLIAPPPVIANPGFGKSYAIAMKRIGLKKGLRVADGYTAFMTARAHAAGEGGDWRRFYRDPESAAPLYHLAPTAAGQALLADTLWRVIFPDKPVPILPPAGEGITVKEDADIGN